MKSIDVRIRFNTLVAPMKNQMPSDEKINARLASWKAWGDKMKMLREIHKEIAPALAKRQRMMEV